MGFRYKGDPKILIIGRLNKAGYNTNRIRQEKILSESTLQKIRENKMVSLQQIERICKLLKCRPEEIIEYVID